MSDKETLLKKRRRSELEEEYVPPPLSFFLRYALLFIITLGVLVVLAAVGFFVAYYVLWTAPTTHGAVSSSDKYAAKVGWDVLQQGGNAIDAMVAMQAVLTVTEPWGSGIGGGAFITYYSQNEKKVHVLDGREEAPRATGNTVPSRIGGTSVGIPGTVAVMARALHNYGTWNLERCLQPAINLARDGWILTPFAAGKIEEGKDILSKFDSSKAIYFDQNGLPKKNGTIMYNPDLAKTLELLSKNGWETFYRGEIANSIIDAIQNAPLNPGSMTLEDLDEYRAVEREPIRVTFKGYEIYGMNMPSSGLTTMSLILNMLEATPLDWIKDGFGSYSSLLIILNAMSVAYADRSQYMADRDFVHVPLDGLLDKNYATRRSLLINLTTAINQASPGNPEGSDQWTFSNVTPTKETYDTTHFSLIDKDYNVVSCTSTLEETWGSGMVVPGSGFLLNNQLTDFTNSGSNAITGNRAPRKTALFPDNSTIGGKRPMSSMTPIIVFQDNLPYLALGSPGGANIICTVVNALLNIITYNMSLSDALAAPRYASRNDGTWRLDQQFYGNQTLISKFKEVGMNNFTQLTEYNGGGVAIVRLLSNGTMDAATDPRKKDSAAYYY